MDRKDARRSKKHTLASYQALVENEYWCGYADCAEQGFIDHLALVKCGASLSGTHEEVIERVNFFGAELELVATLADCPTTTTPLGVKIRKVDSKLSESAIVSKFNRDQRDMLAAIKANAINEFTSKTKRVVYTKIK
jgi:hypothetical protein